MGILQDLQNRLFGEKEMQDIKAPSVLEYAESRKAEIGMSGTFLNSGIIDEDFNQSLQFPKSIDIFDEMRKSDATVQSALKAVKLPLLTANWIVEIAEEGDEAHKEFIKEALFKNLNIPFTEFLSEALAHLDFGFYYFEKVFKAREDGRIVWEKFAPRIPAAHLLWTTTPGKGSGKFKNEGVTQQLQSNEDDPTRTNFNPEIPMTKLLLFINKKEGKNFEGVSLLRSAYKHWKMKNMAETIQIISIERSGVGIPVLKIPKGSTKKERDQAESMLSNLRSNEKGFMIEIGDDWAFRIEGPPSTKGISIDETIKHHNREILMNVLAPFLDLGSGNSGSFALGETQLNFFLNSLQSIAKSISDVMNKAIVELIDINFGVQKVYPKLKATEIGTLDKQSIMNAIQTGVNSGTIIPDEKLREWTRENLNLPEEDIATQAIPEKKVDKKENVDDAKRKKKSQKLAEKPKVARSKRDKTFGKFMNDQDKFVEDFWRTKHLPEIENTEVRIRTLLNKGYKQAKTIKAGGVTIISTRGNSALMNTMRKGIDKEMNALQDKLEQKNFSTLLMNTSAKNAVKTMVALDQIKTFQDILLDAGQVRAFTAGHISNVRGFIFNEGRRLTERLLDNFTQKTQLSLILGQTRNFKMNRNIIKLSVVTHPRALFKNVVFSNAEAQGINRFKVVLPDSKFGGLDPDGNTSNLLFLIFLASQLNRKGDTKNNANVVGGMGFHHNDNTYFYPIDEEHFEEEERIAREERKQFLQSIK